MIGFLETCSWCALRRCAYLFACFFLSCVIVWGHALYGLIYPAGWFSVFLMFQIVCDVWGDVK